MRKSSLSEAEIADLDDSTRKETRKSGFDLMSERDRGWSVVHDEQGTRVAVLWNTKRKPQEGEAIRNIPEGKVVFESSEGTLVFDIDQLKRAIRWA